jgi:hypothetical protein
MRRILWIVVLILNRQFTPVTGERLLYVTSMVTECFEFEPSTNLRTSTAQLPQVTYSMPPCDVCDCPSCTTTSVFTTALPAFCSEQTPTQQTFKATETYVGMSSLPTFATPTTVPYGFTVALETCTICGTEPLTMTMTFPSGGRPYVASVATETDDPSATRDAPSASVGKSTECVTVKSTVHTTLMTLPTNHTRQVTLSSDQSFSTLLMSYTSQYSQSTTLSISDSTGTPSQTMPSILLIAILTLTATRLAPLEDFLEFSIIFPW